MALRRLQRGSSDVVVDADETRPLLEVLRSELGVRSASRGCQDGSCGACRVLLDGALVSSCNARWGDVRDGAKLETYEDVALDPAAIRAVEAFGVERPTRCKMCVGALGVTAVAVARTNAVDPEGREDAVEAALVGATCMCTGRGSWRRALSK
jgi:aerobic-type carbon monoxide dehydrogenase small subunit (CoxS/CutS family)